MSGKCRDISSPPLLLAGGAILTGMTSDAHRDALGEFLNARRAELSPQTVGVPDSGTPQQVRPAAASTARHPHHDSRHGGGHGTDILAWNPLAAALITDFAKVPTEKRYFAHILFTDPAMKSLYADWELTARTASPTCGRAPPNTRTTLN
jgi:MmyB-like transcription regulator ligand binding domain